MLTLDDRIRVFAAVGTVLRNLDKNEQNELVQRARSNNAWFTEESVLFAKEGVQYYLREEKLIQWVGHLTTQPSAVKKIGVVMAGNIPWVGFHDLLTVLICGQHALIKLSSQDSFLMRYIINIITELEPQLGSYITVVDKLNTADAIIATGGDNTSRYFEYYFAKYPHIIRKNRTGVAVLSGNETESELRAVGEDIFRYFGLGCRNVSKLFVPEDYNFEPLFRALEVLPIGSTPPQIQ